MKTITMVAGLVLALVSFGSFSADEPYKAEKAPPRDYFQVVHIDFHYGKHEEAMKFIYEQFMPANAEAKLPEPVAMVEHLTGSWNLTLVFKLEEGLQAFDWNMTADDAKFMNVLAKRAGGKENAEKMMKDYTALIYRVDTSLGFQPRD